MHFQNLTMQKQNENKLILFTKKDASQHLYQLSFLLRHGWLLLCCITIPRVSLLTRYRLATNHLAIAFLLFQFCFHFLC